MGSESLPSVENHQPNNGTSSPRIPRCLVLPAVGATVATTAGLLGGINIDDPKVIPSVKAKKLLRCLILGGLSGLGLEAAIQGGNLAYKGMFSKSSSAKDAFQHKVLYTLLKEADIVTPPPTPSVPGTVITNPEQTAPQPDTSPAPTAPPAPADKPADKPVTTASETATTPENPPATSKPQSWWGQKTMGIPNGYWGAGLAAMGASGLLYHLLTEKKKRKPSGYLSAMGGGLLAGLLGYGAYDLTSQNWNSNNNETKTNPNPEDTSSQVYIQGGLPRNSKGEILRAKVINTGTMTEPKYEVTTFTSPREAGESAQKDLGITLARPYDPNAGYFGQAYNEFSDSFGRGWWANWERATASADQWREEYKLQTGYYPTDEQYNAYRNNLYYSWNPLPISQKEQMVGEAMSMANPNSYVILTDKNGNQFARFVPVGMRKEDVEKQHYLSLERQEQEDKFYNRGKLESGLGGYLNIGDENLSKTIENDLTKYVNSNVNLFCKANFGRPIQEVGITPASAIPEETKPYQDSIKNYIAVTLQGLGVAPTPEAIEAAYAFCQDTYKATNPVETNMALDAMSLAYTTARTDGTKPRYTLDDIPTQYRRQSLKPEAQQLIQQQLTLVQELYKKEQDLLAKARFDTQQSIKFNEGRNHKTQTGAGLNFSLADLVIDWTTGRKRDLSYSDNAPFAESATAKMTEVDEIQKQLNGIRQTIKDIYSDPNSYVPVHANKRMIPPPGLYPKLMLARRNLRNLRKWQKEHPLPPSEGTGQVYREPYSSTKATIDKMKGVYNKTDPQQLEHHPLATQWEAEYQPRIDEFNQMLADIAQRDANRQFRNKANKVYAEQMRQKEQRRQELIRQETKRQMDELDIPEQWQEDIQANNDYYEKHPLEQYKNDMRQWYNRKFQPPYPIPPALQELQNDILKKLEWYRRYDPNYYSYPQ